MGSRFSRVQRWVACALWCGLVAAAQAAAGQPSGEEFLRMFPEERQALVKSWRAQAAAGAGGSATTVDTTPPTLLAFDAGTSVDADDPRNELIVHLTVTDSSSGLRYVYFTAESMLQGVRAYASFAPVPFAANRYNGPTALHMSGFAPPGPWRITAVTAYDLNGNRMEVTEDQLSLMGNTRFTVTGGFNDTVAPVLVGGTILTPKLSLSKPARGTTSPGQVLEVRLQLRDPGTAAVSGIKSASINFCTAPPSRCFGVYSATETRYGLSNVERVLAGQVYDFVGTGDFLIQSVVIRDFTGNETYLASKDFGGSTDFTTLFPSTTVKIKP